MQRSLFLRRRPASMSYLKGDHEPVEVCVCRAGLAQSPSLCVSMGLHARVPERRGGGIALLAGDEVSAYASLCPGPCGMVAPTPRAGLPGEWPRGVAHLYAGRSRCTSRSAPGGESTERAGSWGRAGGDGENAPPRAEAERGPEGDAARAGTHAAPASTSAT